VPVHPLQVVTAPGSDAQRVPVGEQLLRHVHGHELRVDLEDVLEPFDRDVADLPGGRRVVLLVVPVATHVPSSS
jgi:hypothetical protein